MKISLSSVLVNNQAQALAFYTDILGFEKKIDIPAGDHRWLTLVSPGEHDGAQLVLEPNMHPASQVYQAALYADGIPITSFEVADMEAEFKRLTELGVSFKGEPTDIGDAVLVTLDDTCGNYIQLYETK
jgi:catechol 2,3-dioxygenase-like lactoylglutathione lyase family enzyme